MLFEDTTADVAMNALVKSVDKRPPNISLESMHTLKKVYDNLGDPRRNPSMSDRVYNSRVECWTPVGMAKLVVDKVAALTYGKAVKRSSGISGVVGSKIDAAYKGTRGSFIRLSKMASLAGYAAVRVRRAWDGSYSFSVYGFDEVEPILDPSDPHGKVNGIVFTTLVEDLPSWVWKLNPNLKKRKVYRFKEMVTRHLRDESGEIIVPGMNVHFVDGKRINNMTGGFNPLGDYIGAVWWRGMDHPFNPWGASDVIPLMQTLDAINELLTDGRELVVWGIHSPVFTNVQGVLDWKYGPRSVWQPTGSTVGDSAPFVKRLETGTAGLQDLKSFLEILLKLFHQFSRIPSVSLGDMEGAGAASSGRAFEIAMTPAKELIAEKENSFVPQEEELMRELYAKMVYYEDVVGETYELFGFNMPDAFSVNDALAAVSIEFTPMTFPQEVIAESLSGQVNAGIRSRKNAVERLHPSWDENQVDTEIQTIIVDMNQKGNAAE